MARPGCNRTGISISLAGELNIKSLRLLHEIIPALPFRAGRPDDCAADPRLASTAAALELVTRAAATRRPSPGPSKS